jgi:hypothetical protein
MREYFESKYPAKLPNTKHIWSGPGSNDLSPGAFITLCESLATAFPDSPLQPAY